MSYTAPLLIKHFDLQPHPEGGWYKETYRCGNVILKHHLPDGFSGDRNVSTAIYFLLETPHFSAFHRIRSDEVWHFYFGSPLNIYVINENGKLEIISLGNNPAKGEVFQAVVKKGLWFASRPAHENSFALVGCTVAPGFDFADFEMAERANLLQSFPVHKDIIIQLTR